MKHGSLFSGIGGFDLAAEWMGWENVFQVEKNEWCLKKLEKNYPNTKRFNDVFQFTGQSCAGRIDVLTGGFPCQTFSVAGTGTTDITLWKEMYRVITEIKPPFVVAENVPGIVSRKNGMAFDIVCSDLENYGYEIIPLNLPIAGKGAPHKRERIWFVAYSHRFRCENEQKENGQIIYYQKRNDQASEQIGTKLKCGTGESDSHATNSESSKQERSIISRSRRDGFTDNNCDTSNTECLGSQGPRKSGGQLRSEENTIRQTDWPLNENQFEENWYEVATRLCRMDDGLPDRVYRLEALGNSISPHLALDLFRIIELIV